MCFYGNGETNVDNPPSCFQGGNGEGNDRTPGSVGKAVVAVTTVTDQSLIRLRSDQSLRLRAVVMATELCSMRDVAVTSLARRSAVGSLTANLTPLFFLTFTFCSQGRSLV